MDVAMKLVIRYRNSGVVGPES